MEFEMNIYILLSIKEINKDLQNNIGNYTQIL